MGSLRKPARASAKRFIKLRIPGNYPVRLLRLIAIALCFSCLVPAATVSFTDTSDWGAGEIGEITITNDGVSAINGWLVQFDFGGSITSIWSGTITTHAGNFYEVSDAGYNSAIPVNGQASFGFTAAPGGTTPTNMSVYLPTPLVTVTFADVTDWGSGEEGLITIANYSGSPIDDWTLQFDFGASISSIWNANVIGHSGNVYRVTNTNTDATIPANGQVSFGFVSSLGGVQADNFFLNGLAASGTPPVTTATSEPSYMFVTVLLLSLTAIASRRYRRA